MNNIKIYELYYYDSQEEKVNYGYGTITEVIGMVEQWVKDNYDILDNEFENDEFETLRYFFKNPTEWFDRRNETNGLWDDEFWNDFYIDEIYTMNLSEIENDLVELCEDNDVMKDVIKDYFKKEVTNE